VPTVDGLVSIGILEMCHTTTFLGPFLFFSRLHKILSFVFVALAPTGVFFSFFLAPGQLAIFTYPSNLEKNHMTHRIVFLTK